MDDTENPPGRTEEESPAAAPVNRSIVIFLICLVIATIIWFLNALSKDYQTTVDHPVAYTDIPVSRFIANNPPARLILKVGGQGFSLMKYRLTASFSPIGLNVSRLMAETPPTQAGVTVVPEERIRSIVSAQISKELQLLSVSPSLITLDFDTLAIRKVPVGSRLELGFKPRYDLVGRLAFRPSYVTVTGPALVLDAIDTVFTVPYVFKNLESSFSQEVQLSIPRQTVVEPARVSLSAVIDEFTEKTMRVPVWVENQPPDLRIRLFPNEVEVRFMTGLKAFALIKPEDFHLSVSWDQAQAESTLLKIRISKQPATVKAVRISPGHVEYLIEKP